MNDIIEPKVVEPKYAPTELCIEKKVVQLDERFVQWPYYSPFRAVLATITMGSFAAFLMTLFCVLLGENGTIPFWMPILFLAAALIAGVFHANWKCHIELDKEKRTLSYFVGTKKQPLCSLDDINVIGVNGRRQEQAAGTWWWEYAVIAITWEGLTIPIIAPEVEELDKTNRNAKALAAYLDLPVIEGKKRNILHVEQDHKRGKLAFSLEERLNESYDAWPNFTPNYIPVTKKLESKERTVE